MSELKATTVYNAYWKANSTVEGTCTLVYLKSEADKVIAHSKYKRCLAMANYCHESAMWLEENGVNKCTVFMLRWEKRWLELAEKFKEGE